MRTALPPTVIALPDEPEPESGPVVALVFRDGTSMALPAQDPRSRPFQLVARELGRTTKR